MDTHQIHRHDDPRLVAAAERQMHTWALHRESQERAMHAQPAAPPALRFVTISREAGVGGSRMAELIGQRLGWKVFDKQIIDQVATQFHLSRDMLELVDETPGNWVYDILGTWVNQQIVSHEKYVADLCRVVAAAARKGSAVFVGRGAQFLLPRDETLAVRVIASKKHRLQQIMAERSLDADKAQQYLDDTDHGRRDFVARFFHHDIHDPHLYDMVLNVEQLGVEKAVGIVVETVGG